VLTPAGAWHGGALGSCWVHPRVAWALAIFPDDLGCLRVANPWESSCGRPAKLGKDRGSLFGCFHFLLSNISVVGLPGTAFALNVGKDMLVFVYLYVLCACYSYPTKHSGRDCWWKNLLRVST
jgi:hypothetical protein